ncbi:amidohydrolase family protein [Nocardiopsis sp. EMB25]|uniref:amidohydrolase family protein n=1 Tax=Nocardiopsis TaxID=2013 RepID=UPI000348AD91|nr:MULTISPECIES: amidohydrolase family protein [Nocardiopsis]MCY9786957.1 amidohydrolase family protein [Nocardiopsis sp. EMB25]
MDTRVFDAHAHLAPGAEATDRLLTTMDGCGIDRAVVVAGGTIDPLRLSRQIIEGGGSTEDVDNDAVLAGCERSGGRLVPFFFANPHSGPDAYREAGAGFRGLKLAPGVHGVRISDPRTHALVGVAKDLGHPVYLHCLARAGFGVTDLVDLAAREPDVTFVLGHAGVGDMDLYGIESIRPRPNILFETSGGYSAVVAAALRRLGPERVLFGSEYPLQHPEVELVKYRLLGLEEPAWRRVTWTNARLLVGEEPAP